MNQLYLKHLIATSALAGPAERARRLIAALRGLAHPELGLLRQEDRMMGVVLERLLTRSSNCIDIGAHVGSVSAVFHKLAPDGQHIIVEAAPEKAAWLRRRFTRATVHQVAVSNSTGNVSFFENIDQPGFSSLSDRTSRGATREIRVDCKRLDDLIPADHNVDFIKIDVEGHEHDALLGGGETISRCRPTILFEAGAEGDADTDPEANLRLFRLLTSDMGYDVRAVFDAYYNRPAITEADFAAYRTYPFLAFNYVATPSAGSH